VVSLRSPEATVGHWVHTLKTLCFILLALGSGTLGAYSVWLSRLAPGCPYFAIVWSFGGSAYFEGYLLLVLFFLQVQSRGSGADVKNAGFWGLVAACVYAVVTVLLWLLVLLPSQNLVRVGEYGAWVVGMLFLVGLQVTIVRVLHRFWLNHTSPWSSHTSGLLSMSSSGAIVRSRKARAAEVRMAYHLCISLVTGLTYEIALAYYMASASLDRDSTFLICQYIFYAATAAQHINFLIWLEPRLLSLFRIRRNETVAVGGPSLSPPSSEEPNVSEERLGVEFEDGPATVDSADIAPT